MAVRYRAGIDCSTGRTLGGWDHCRQSLAIILTTMKGERVMRLGFGSGILAKIGRNLTAPVVLAIYQDIVDAISHPRYGEPEFRLRRVQIVEVTRVGGLQMRLWGDYYPEGRLGNFALVEPQSAVFPLALTETGAAA